MGLGLGLGLGLGCVLPWFLHSTTPMRHARSSLPARSVKGSVGNRVLTCDRGDGGVERGGAGWRGAGRGVAGLGWGGAVRGWCGVGAGLVRGWGGRDERGWGRRDGRGWGGRRTSLKKAREVFILSEYFCSRSRLKTVVPG